MAANVDTHDGYFTVG